MEKIDAAATAIRDGQLVVYPTETVYGLGADAFSPSAIERVYALKQRSRENPLSVAIPSIDSIDTVARPTARSRDFIESFLPGPITVICERAPQLPAMVTANSLRVGIRIPDHPLATAFLNQSGPITATSANISGNPSISQIEELDPAIESEVSVILDGGKTTGSASTVVDIDNRVIHRRGPKAQAIEAWLESN